MDTPKFTESASFDSKYVEKLEYDRANRALTVYYQNKNKFKFLGVPSNVFDTLLNSNNVHDSLLIHVVGNHYFPCSKIAN